MTFTLPDLPYERSALEPFYTANVISYHYDKHHQAYVTNLNNLVGDGHIYKGETLIDIIKESKKKNEAGIFNNAAQIWNHTFFWHCMAPNANSVPSGDLLKLIEKNFGSIDQFKAEFKQAAITQFGSGWAWLVQEGNSDVLKIVKTPNADTPLTEQGLNPLLTIDVWEHAYYLDYQNRRPDFIQTFMDHLINWSFVEENLNK